MAKTRQDAWTKDEDILLAETVLMYIRRGKTQLEAFKKVAEQLSRTSAACGFRWNATIRKQYENAIELAKEEKKRGFQNKNWTYIDSSREHDRETIDTAILLLKEMKNQSVNQIGTVQNEQQTVKLLRKENERLKEMLVRYDDAWKEMGVLWNWVKNPDRE